MKFVTVFFVPQKSGANHYVTALVDATWDQINETVERIFVLTNQEGPVCHTDIPLAGDAIDPKTLAFTTLPEA